MTRQASYVWGMWFLMLFLDGAYLALVIVNWHAPTRDTAIDRAAISIVILALSTCAALVISRRPRNPIGWLLIVATFAIVVTVLAFEYAVRAVLTDPGTLPAGSYAVWLYNWGWTPLLLMIAPGMPLFPDGRLPSPRWRPLVWATLALVLLLNLGAATEPTLTLDGSVSVENPLGVGWGPQPDSPPAKALLVIGVLFLLANATAPVVRYKHAGLIERQQLKWVMFAGLVFVVTLALVLPLDSTNGFARDVASLLYVLSLLGIPVSITIAILRYGLYDIDRIISRTLTYGLLTAGLGLTYLALVIGLQTLLRPLSGGSDFAIVVTTLVVAALFLPTRRRVQSAVDRRFNRRAYDAARTIEVFNARLRQQLDLDTLRTEVLGIVEETVAPQAAGLWLRSRR